MQRTTIANWVIIYCCVLQFLSPFQKIHCTSLILWDLTFYKPSNQNYHLFHLSYTIQKSSKNTRTQARNIFDLLLIESHFCWLTLATKRIVSTWMLISTSRGAAVRAKPWAREKCYIHCTENKQKLDYSGTTGKFLHTHGPMSFVKFGVPVVSTSSWLTGVKYRTCGQHSGYSSGIQTSTFRSVNRWELYIVQITYSEDEWLWWL